MIWIANQCFLIGASTFQQNGGLFSWRDLPEVGNHYTRVKKNTYSAISDHERLKVKFVIP